MVTKSARQKLRGAVFVEFLIVFMTVLIPMGVAITNLGRIIWQMQYLSDASREVAREVAIKSDRFPNLECSDLHTAAETSAESNLTSNKNWGMSNIWLVYVSIDGGIQFTANNASPGNSAKFSVIKVEYGTSDEIENCLFCINDFILQSFEIYVWGVMDLNANSRCTIG